LTEDAAVSVSNDIVQGSAAFEDAIQDEILAANPGAVIDVLAITPTVEEPPKEPSNGWKAAVGVILGVIALTAIGVIFFGEMCGANGGFRETDGFEETFEENFTEDEFFSDGSEMMINERIRGRTDIEMLM